MVPRLTEIFLIREASAGNIARILGLPMPVAQGFVELDKKNAFALAKIFVAQESNLNRGWDGPYDQDPPPGWKEDTNKSYKNWIAQYENASRQDVLDLIQRFMRAGDHGLWFYNFLQDNPWAEEYINKIEFPKIGNSQMADLNALAADLDSMAAARGPRIDPKRAEITYPDGYHWIMLETKEECSAEGKEMQHCGASPFDMYSLRDKQGHPHVTVEIGRNFEDGPEHIITQISGKQNRFPDQKYWSYVRDFIRKKDAMIEDHLDRNNPGFLDYIEDRNTGTA